MPLATDASYTAFTCSSVNLELLISPPSRMVQSNTRNSGRYVIHGALSVVMMMNSLQKMRLPDNGPHPACQADSATHHPTRTRRGPAGMHHTCGAVPRQTPRLVVLPKLKLEILTHRLNLPKQPVPLTTDARREEQHLARRAIIIALVILFLVRRRRGSTKLQSPQAIDRNHVAPHIRQLSQERPRARVKRVDRPIAEIPDQQRV